MKSGSKKPKSEISKSSFVAEKPDNKSIVIQDTTEEKAVVMIQDTEEKANDLS